MENPDLNAIDASFVPASTTAHLDNRRLLWAHPMPALVTLMFLAWMGQSATYPILPDILLQEQCQSLKVPPAECSTSTTAQAAQATASAELGLLTGIPALLSSSFVTHLSDVLGRRWLLICMLIAGICNATAIATWGLATAKTVCLMCICNAIGDVLIISAVVCASVADISSDLLVSERARRLGLVECGIWIGQIVGPSVGGYVSTLIGPQRAMLAPAILGCVALALICTAIPETLSNNNRARFCWRYCFPGSNLPILCRFRRSVGAAGCLLLAHWGLTTGMSTWPLWCKIQYDWPDSMIGALDSVFFLANSIGLLILLPILLRALQTKHMLLCALAGSVIMWSAHIFVAQGWMLFPICCVGALAATPYPLLRSCVLEDVGHQLHGAATGALALLESVAKLCGGFVASITWRWINTAPNVADGVSYLIASTEFVLAFLIVVWTFSTVRPAPVHNMRALDT